MFRLNPLSRDIREIEYHGYVARTPGNAAPRLRPRAETPSGYGGRICVRPGLERRARAESPEPAGAEGADCSGPAGAVPRTSTPASRRRWSPGEFLVLSTLMSDRGGRYQISGPNVFHRYGWTDQVPNRLYVYNNRISGDRQIGAVSLTFIEIADERLGGIEIVRVPERIDVVYASKARALVERGLRLVAVRWSSQSVRLDPSRGKKRRRVRRGTHPVTVQFGNQGTVRRIGELLERETVPEALLRRLEREVRPSSSFIPWIPNREKRGKSTRDGEWSSTMGSEPEGPWYHDDRSRFRDALSFTRG